MQRPAWGLYIGFLIVIITCVSARQAAGEAFTWQEVRDRFVVANPTLQAARIGIDESRAQEITANLRPNPQFTAATDYLHPLNTKGQQFIDAQPTIAFSYLFERMNKRGLRRESAEKGTLVAISQAADLERNLIFNLRGAFIQVLEQKAVLALAIDNLAYYDKVLDVSAHRLKTGDIAQIDLDRLELQRVQFESDVQTSMVNLRTAKIQLLTLLNDRTPVDQFDVAGPFEFSEKVSPLTEFREAALQARPDLKAAARSIEQAKTNRQLAEANASTDPTVGIDVGRFPQALAPGPDTPSAVSFMGFSVSIPLRIFDRNQGERLRTKLDIGPSERLRDAVEAQLFGDVDSAHATLASTVIFLKPYKERYLDQAVRVRDTMTFSYERGGASLLDFLGAQRDYRTVRLAYLNLVGSYLPPQPSSISRWAGR